VLRYRAVVTCDLILMAKLIFNRMAYEISVCVWFSLLCVKLLSKVKPRLTHGAAERRRRRFYTAAAAAD